MAKGNFKKKTEKIFWDSYASAYDDMAKYYEPYKQLVNEITGFLATNAGKDSRVLDAGCGTGALSIKLAEKKYAVYSMDMSNAMLSVFRGKIKKMNLDNLYISNGDLNKKLVYKSKYFNIVINVHSLFMLDNIFFTLDEFNSGMNPFVWTLGLEQTGLFL